jgi:hypothetical protein
MKRKHWGISIRDLLDVGLLLPYQGLRLFNREALTAHITPDGAISFRRQRYRTPTPAAEAFSGTSVDGWRVWWVRDAGMDAGDWVRLEHIRDRYASSRLGRRRTSRP